MKALREVGTQHFGRAIRCVSRYGPVVSLDVARNRRFMLDGGRFTTDVPR